MTDGMGKKRPAGQRPDIAIWLGTGAVSLGIGAAALVGGTALAHADTHESAGSARSSVGSAAPHAGPKATAHKAPHISPAAARKTASSVTTASAEVAPPRLVKTPLQVFCDGSVRLLVALGGMDQTTPTPAPGNLWQQGLYSVARWLQDTVYPAGIPKIQTVSLGDPDQLTGVVNGRILSANAAGDPQAYQVTVDPKLGKVTVNADGSFTFTPLTSTMLGAPDAGLQVEMKVSAFNGVQRADQIIVTPIGNPWALLKQTVSVGNTPLQVAASPDGARMVVTNGADGTVSLINTATNKVVATIPVGAQPAGVVFDPTGTRFYVVNATGAVTAVSLPANTVGAPVTIGIPSLLAAIGPAGTPAAGQLYVANFGTNGTGHTVTVVNTATNQVSATVPVGNGPEELAISPDGTRLWVGNTVANSITVIDTATNSTVKTLPVATGVGFIALSPDGQLAYVSDLTSLNTVSVFNTATYAKVGTITVGQQPGGIALSADGSVAYVTNQMDNTVSVVNTATRTVIKTITVGHNPLGLAITPDGKFLYVTNINDATVTVIPV